MILWDGEGRRYRLPQQGRRSDARRIRPDAGIWAGIGVALVIEAVAVAGALGIAWLLGWVG